MSKKLPTYFVSHGGGPWPWLDDWRPMMAQLEASLVRIAAEVGEKPKAVLVVTGHWEEREFTVSTAAKPGMVYDYGGFPPHTYQVVYPAPGEPSVGERALALLAAAGVPARADDRRGYDHGTFTPLVAIYPDADVPIVQVSIKLGYDPEAHLAAGRALAPLREEGVLIVGSGLSYHNLREMGPRAKDTSKRFDDWLQATMAAAPAERTARLKAWSEAPDARKAHPEEDHLIPLMVAVGAAEGEASACVYHQEDFFGGVTASSFRLGAVAAQPVA